MWSKIATCTLASLLLAGCCCLAEAVETGDSSAGNPSSGGKVVTMEVQRDTNLGSPVGKSALYGKVDTRNETLCSEECRRDESCAGAALGRVGEVWESGYTCYVYDSGYLVSASQPGWTTFLKRIDGFLYKLTAGADILSVGHGGRQTVYVRHAGPGLADTSDDVGDMQRGTSIAIVALVVIVVVFFGICCSVQRPRNTDTGQPILDELERPIKSAKSRASPLRVHPGSARRPPTTLKAQGSLYRAATHSPRVKRPSVIAGNVYYAQKKP